MSIELSATKFLPKKNRRGSFFHFGDGAKIFDSAGGDQSAAGENFDVLGLIYVLFRAKLFNFNELKKYCPKMLN